MEVGVELEALAPAVEYGAEAELGAEMPGVGGEGLEALGGSGEEEIEDESFVAQRDGIERLGEREDDMEVGDGEEALAPLVEPLGFLEALAFGTVAVPAGIVGDTDVATASAGVLVATECGGAATGDPLKDLALA